MTRADSYNRTAIFPSDIPSIHPPMEIMRNPRKTHRTRLTANNQTCSVWKTLSKTVSVDWQGRDWYYGHTYADLNKLTQRTDINPYSNDVMGPIIFTLQIPEMYISPCFDTLLSFMYYVCEGLTSTQQISLSLFIYWSFFYNIYQWSKRKLKWTRERERERYFMFSEIFPDFLWKEHLSLFRDGQFFRVSRKSLIIITCLLFLHIGRTSLKHSYLFKNINYWYHRKKNDYEISLLAVLCPLNHVYTCS